MADELQAKRIEDIATRWFLNKGLYFQILCTHKCVQNESMKVPFRTGHFEIQYNPKLTVQMSDSQLEGFLEVEIIRILLLHPYRTPRNQTVNPALAAAASDIIISDTCPVSVPLMSGSYYGMDKGLCFEEIYKKLSLIMPPSMASDDSENNSAEKTGGSGKKDGKSDELSLKKSMEFTRENFSEKAELWETEDEEASEKIKDVIEKVQKNNQWGNISGKLKEQILGSLIIPMDYRKILSQFRANIISQRRKLTRMKPNRRYGFDYMGSKSEPKTHLLVAVDVSGSIQSEDLEHFLSIINRFFSYGVEFIKVIAFDTKITQEFELKKAGKNIQIIGRGGTNLQVPVDYYETHPEYQGLVLFSDCYANPPHITKNKQIVWILTNKDDYNHSIGWIKKLKGSRATWIPC